MKKHIVTIIICLFSVSAYSQQDSIPLVNDLIEYNGIIQCPNKSSAEIYLNLKKWLSAIHRDTKAVIDVDDKDGGLLIVKDNSFLSNKVGTRTAFYSLRSYQTLKFEIKDNRFRYTFNNIELSFSVITFLYGTLNNRMRAENFYVNANTAKNEISARHESLNLLDRQLKGLIANAEKYVNDTNENTDNW